MEDIKDKIDKFFDDYETRFNNALTGKDLDIEGTIKSLAECFIEASPIGVQCGKNDEKFKEVIPQGYAFYKSIGTRSMTILSKEISILDEYHTMVKVKWHSIYDKNNGIEEVIDFEVRYFLQMREGQLKIFAYITGDEHRVLREHGLLPDK